MDRSRGVESSRRNVGVCPSPTVERLRSALEKSRTPLKCACGTRRYRGPRETRRSIVVVLRVRSSKRSSGRFYIPEAHFKAVLPAARHSVFGGGGGGDEGEDVGRQRPGEVPGGVRRQAQSRGRGGGAADGVSRETVPKASPAGDRPAQRGAARPLGREVPSGVVLASARRAGQINSGDPRSTPITNFDQLDRTPLEVPAQQRGAGVRPSMPAP